MHFSLLRVSKLCYSVILVLIISSCAPKKESISETDMQRVMERFASARIQTGIVSDVNRPAPSDQSLFEEACEVYRLPVDKAKIYLKEKNLPLYESIYGN